MWFLHPEKLYHLLSNLLLKIYSAIYFETKFTLKMYMFLSYLPHIPKFCSN